MSLARKCAQVFRRTPFHPQWLLGPRTPPRTINRASGLVLDIGSADRWITRHLPAGISYFSLDYPATANAFYQSKPDIFGDAGRLPFADSCFDNIICLEVIEHLPAPSSAIAEIARVLKPGGEAWVSVPFMYPIHNEPFDFQRFTEYGLRLEFERANFELLELRGEGHAIQAAGLLMTLAVAGGVYEKRSNFIGWLLAPLALLSVLFVNLASFAMASILPNWEHMPTNYHLHLRKPRLATRTY